MEKSNKNKIIIGVSAVLVAGIVVIAAILVSRQVKEKKYYTQLQNARIYITNMDYDSGVEAYKAAIEINPEAADAYIELAEAYIDMGDYTEATYTAELGSLKSGSRSFQALMNKLDEIRDRGEVVVTDVAGGEENTALDEVRENVSVRYGMIENAANFCYQEYVNTYGSATMSKISDEEGYRAKFQGFGGYACFKNTSENRNVIDEATRRPAKNAKPYKVVVTSPDLLFVGYGETVSKARLGQMFGIDIAPVYDETQKKYFVEFEYMGCRIRLETDEKGNLADEPILELYPLNLIKEDWVEEETETEETEEVETFTLGSFTYTYDVTSIVIMGENIGDLSPLSECKNLRELVLVSCTIDSLGPLSGCSSLEILDLRRTTGFSDLSPLSGLSNLLYLDLHSASDVSDLSPVMGLSLKLLHTCETGITREQAQAYKDAHPDCEVWYDNHTI